MKAKMEDKCACSLKQENRLSLRFCRKCRKRFKSIASWLESVRMEDMWVKKNDAGKRN